VSLLGDLDAFFTDHRDCGDLEAGVEWPIVWIACPCGASMERRADGEDNMPSPDHLAAATDTRGRRLRAALAAGLIRAHAGRTSAAG
jgi:hypothetical protein